MCNAVLLVAHCNCGTVVQAAAQCISLQISIITHVVLYER